MNQKLKFLYFRGIHNSLPSFWAKLGYSWFKIDHIADSLLKLQIKIGVHLINAELSQLLTLLWTNWHLPGICLSCDSQFSQYHCWCWLWLYWSNLWHIAQTRLRRPTQRYVLSNSCPVKNAQTWLRNCEMDKTKMRFVRIFVWCTNTTVLYPLE